MNNIEYIKGFVKKASKLSKLIAMGKLSPKMTTQLSNYSPGHIADAMRDYMDVSHPSIQNIVRNNMFELPKQLRKTLPDLVRGGTSSLDEIADDVSLGLKHHIKNEENGLPYGYTSLDILRRHLRNHKLGKSK